MKLLLEESDVLRDVLQTYFYPEPSVYVSASHKQGRRNIAVTITSSEVVRKQTFEPQTEVLKQLQVVLQHVRLRPKETVTAKVVR